MQTKLFSLWLPKEVAPTVLLSGKWAGDGKVLPHASQQVSKFGASKRFCVTLSNGRIEPWLRAFQNESCWANSFSSFPRDGV